MKLKVGMDIWRVNKGVVGGVGGFPIFSQMCFLRNYQDQFTSTSNILIQNNLEPLSLSYICMVTPML